MRPVSRGLASTMLVLAFACFHCLPANAQGHVDPDVDLTDPYHPVGGDINGPTAEFMDALAELEARIARTPHVLSPELQEILDELHQRAQDGERGDAKNVIFFVGDGMGLSTLTTARILAGQLQGTAGEEYELFFETFPNTALSKTYNANQQVPDSAGTMSSMSTGVKTKAGLISVGPDALRSDHTTHAGNQKITILELCERAGLATGVVSTARLTHATPAANYAHVVERNWEADSDMTDAAIDDGYVDIARQLIEFPFGDGLEVAMGGGRTKFLSERDFDPEYIDFPGERRDLRNLPQEWLNKHERSAYVWNLEQFRAVDATQTDHLLGLFERSHLNWEHLRASDDLAGEPSLSEMVDKSIDVLEKYEQGYFLMVESGRIDHGHHLNWPYAALTETIELAKAVELAASKVDLSETMIVVTADHSHVFTFAGYPTRGNAIFGKLIPNDKYGLVDKGYKLDREKLPYTSLGYSNGYIKNFIPWPREDLIDVDTSSSNYQQEFLIPLRNESHGGEDVAVYATGPGSLQFRGLIEQNVINHNILRALFGPRERKQFDAK